MKSAIVYKKYFRPLALAGVILFLLVGCSYPIKYLHTFTDKTMLHFTYKFSDGGSAQYFYLEKKLKSSSPVKNPSTYLFVVGGSDCSSFAYFLPQYFRGLEGESGDVHIYMLQKRFIGLRTWGRVWGCSKEFIQADYPEQWIADQLDFIRQELSLLDKRADRRIVLLGISEGGEIVPILAQHIPQVTHMVILANGGLDPLDAYSLQRSKHGLLPAEELRKLFESHIPNINENGDLILGRTAKYWLQVKNIRQMDNLLRSKVPVLMAMGTEDQVVPIESARYAKEKFEKQSNSHFRLLEYPGADHSLADQKVNFLPDFFHKMDLWLVENSDTIFDGVP